MKSLQWLRGWVSPDRVYDEYQSLQKYTSSTKACNNCTKQLIECNHSETVADKLRQFSRKRIFKPFILITTLEFFTQFCGVMSWRPYIIQIINAYKIRLNANLTTLIMSTFGFAVRIMLLSIIKFVGKRKIYLTSSIATMFCCFGLSWFYFESKSYGISVFELFLLFLLGIFGFIFFPPEWSSFQNSTNGIANVNSTTHFWIHRKLQLLGPGTVLDHAILRYNWYYHSHFTRAKCFHSSKLDFVERRHSSIFDTILSI